MGAIVLSLPIIRRAGNEVLTSHSVVLTRLVSFTQQVASSVLDAIGYNLLEYLVRFVSHDAAIPSRLREDHPPLPIVPSTRSG